MSMGHNEFLGEVQHRLIDRGFIPPVWPSNTTRDLGDQEGAIRSCVQWCEDRLRERDELLAAMTDLIEGLELRWGIVAAESGWTHDPTLMDRARAAIAKATKEGRA